MKKAAADILENLILRYPKLSGCRQDVEKAFHLVKGCYEQGGKVMVCGNGGSAADAEHIVGELMKGFMLKRPIMKEEADKLVSAFPEDGLLLAGRLQRALPAIALVSHTSLLTAVCNDISANMVFAQQVFGHGRAGDALIGISTSGNADNVVNAVKVAKAFGLSTLGFTGEGGGMLAGVCDVAIRLPAQETYLVQELTQPVYHALCQMIEYEFFFVKRSTYSITRPQPIKVAPLAHTACPDPFVLFASCLLLLWVLQY